MNKDQRILKPCYNRASPNLIIIIDMVERRDPGGILPKIENLRAEELLARFRSKEDLYHYMTNQSKYLTKTNLMTIVGLFLPSYSGTKVVFLRAIVADQKKVLKQREITTIIVPHYEELTVKALYHEAITDPLVS